MKKLLLSAAVSVAALAQASAAVLDFEAFGAANGEPFLLGNEFAAAFGVSFSSSDDELRIVRVGSPTDGFVPNDTPNPADAFGSYFLGTSFDDRFTDLTITYATPVDGLSFEMGDIDGREIFTIEIFDAADNLIQTRTIEAGDPNTGDRAVTPVGISGLGVQIAKVVLTGERRNGGNLGIAFDNFSVSRDATIPLPGALPLFGAAAAGFAAVRRRRR